MHRTCLELPKPPGRQAATADYTQELERQMFASFARRFSSTLSTALTVARTADTLSHLRSDPVRKAVRLLRVQIEHGRLEKPHLFMSVLERLPNLEAIAIGRALNSYAFDVPLEQIGRGLLTTNTSIARFELDRCRTTPAAIRDVLVILAPTLKRLRLTELWTYD